MIPASEALKRLEEGNKRFVTGQTAARSVTPAQLAAAQNPFAIILGCSDSRVPSEIVFDQGLGDLFVIRVAGNIVEPTQIGSVEFAAEQFGTRLVVVLGHSNCGAVNATLEQFEHPIELRSPNLRSIVNWIWPSVEKVVQQGVTDRADLLESAVRANICASTERLRSGSDTLASMIREQGLMVVGAEYCLDTGRVDFFDGMHGLG